MEQPIVLNTEIVRLCEAEGFKECFVMVANDNDISVHTTTLYGYTIRPSLVRICRELHRMTGQVWYYVEESYTERTILNFRKI